MRTLVRDLIAVAFVAGGIGLASLAYLWFSGRLATRDLRAVTVVFDDVTGLQVGDPVQVLGVPAGKVISLTLADRKIRCRLGLKPSVVPTEDTKFTIRSVSYLSSDRYVAVEPGAGLRAERNFVFQGTNEALNLDETFLRLGRALAEFQPSDLGKEVGAQAKVLVSDLSAQLAQLGAEVSSQLGQFSSGIEQFNSGFTSTADRLGQLAGTMDSLRALLTNTSTAGRLLDTDELYQEVRRTNRQAQELLQDIRENPGRYFKVKLF